MKYIKALDAKKPVVYCGDLNVAHSEIGLFFDKASSGTVIGDSRTHWLQIWLTQRRIHERPVSPKRSETISVDFSLRVSSTHSERSIRRRKTPTHSGATWATLARRTLAGTGNIGRWLIGALAQLFVARRLDYFVLSGRLGSSLCDSVIDSDVDGSDHCPITLHLAL